MIRASSSDSANAKAARVVTTGVECGRVHAGTVALEFADEKPGRCLIFDNHRLPAAPRQIDHADGAARCSSGKCRGSTGVDPPPCPAVKLPTTGACVYRHRSKMVREGIVVELPQSNCIQPLEVADHQFFQVLLDEFCLQPLENGAEMLTVELRNDLPTIWNGTGRRELRDAI